jgi:spermidine synthase
VVGLSFVFFLSGACGLAYEVVWTRLLGLAVGHTTLALTAVVAAFMGGLAAGSAFFGRRLERGSDPVRLYAALEGGIALVASMFPAQLALVDLLSTHVGRLLDSDTFALGAARFALAALAVAPATFLMGGTLPAMVALVSQRRTGGLARHAGVLYAINTAGAVCGATAAGFALIERLGTFETTWLAAAGNLVVAALALAIGRQPVAGQPPEQRQKTTRRRTDRSAVDDDAVPRAVLWAYALSGFAALSLEVVWTRALLFFAGSTTYAFTSMLVVFLSGITIGSAVAAPLVERLRRPAFWFVAVQALVALSAAASLRVLRLATPAIDAFWPPDRSWTPLVAGNFAKAAAAMAVPTLLMGIAFPIAVRLARASSGGRAEPAAAGRVLGGLYAANTVGGIFGAALTGLVLIPALGVSGTLLAASLVSVVAGGVIVRTREPSRAATASITAAATIGSILLASGGGALHLPAGSERLIFYEEGTAATISVMQEVTGTRTLYIDRVPVAGTDSIMLTDQKSLAHVPMLLNPAARRVLTVGFGSGGASWSFSRYRSLDRIDCVEIDPSVFRAAPHLEASNHAVWRDPRFHLILEDARNYLASTTALYDVVSTDCTDLRYKSNANLYTTDYFSLCRRRLRPGGIVTVWMPLGGLGGDTFRMALRTFRRVFPHTTVWYMTNQPTHYLLLIGADRSLEVSLTAIVDQMEDPAVRGDLAEIRLDDPMKVAASLLLDEQETERLAGEGPLNSDRHPLLEFEAPRLAYRDALLANLRATAGTRDRGPGLTRWRGGPGLLAALEPYVASTPALVEGHARYQQGTFDYAGALRLYRAAAVLNPEDRSIPPLIADVERTRQTWLDEFAARTAANTHDVRDWLAYATLLRQVGRTSDAIAVARRATELDPTSAEARVKLAAALAAAGDNHSAADMLERARQAVPNDPVILTDLGAAYNEQQQFERAAGVLRQSLALAPDAADAHNNLGIALNGLKQPVDAVQQLRRALALNRAFPEAWFNLGVSYASLGNLDEARVAYGEGLALAPGEPRALYNLALIEAQAGRLGEAARRLREAVEQEPSSAELRNELGRVYLQLNLPEQAVSEFERARAIDPASAAIAENLRLASEMLNRPQRRK